jgi:hypothetical protein
MQELAPICIVSPNETLGAINNNGFVCIIITMINELNVIKR